MPLLRSLVLFAGYGYKDFAPTALGKARLNSVVVSHLGVFALKDNSFLFRGHADLPQTDNPAIPLAP
jgi:hypothetical protein